MHECADKSMQTKLGVHGLAQFSTAKQVLQRLSRPHTHAEQRLPFKAAFKFQPEAGIGGLLHANQGSGIHCAY